MPQHTGFPLSAKNLNVNLMKPAFLQTIAVQAPSNTWMALGLPSPGMPTEQPSSLLLPYTGLFQLRHDFPAFLPVILDVFSLKIDRRPSPVLQDLYPQSPLPLLLITKRSRSTSSAPSNL
jgi:hypothetical protein